MSFYREKRKIGIKTLWSTSFYFLSKLENREKRRFIVKLESDFQKNLKKELKSMFPGCIVTKLDSGDIQGIPDLLILYKNKWATLENKRHSKAAKQPNQEYYVEKMNQMSFSRFIYPENKDEVLDELKNVFRE
jgi:hypothetical protein